jgi:hypothetical protein
MAGRQRLNGYRLVDHKVHWLKIQSVPWGNSGVGQRVWPFLTRGVLATSLKKYILFNYKVEWIKKSVQTAAGDFRI